MPRDEVPLSLAVTPFANPDSGTPVVRVSVDVGAFVRSDGAPVPLDIAILAVDSTGRRVASARQTSTVTARRPLSGSPFTLDVQSHLPLPPGDFGVRVAVSDPGAGKVGSVFTDITVPELCRRAVVVVGCQRRARRHDHRRPHGHDAPAFQAHGTGSRRSSDVSGHRANQAGGLGVHARAHSRRQQAWPSTIGRSTYPAETFTKRRAGCVIELPLEKLTAGEYLVKFDASADGQTSGRTLRLSVE